MSYYIFVFVNVIRRTHSCCLRTSACKSQTSSRKDNRSWLAGGCGICNTIRTGFAASCSRSRRIRCIGNRYSGNAPNLRSSLNLEWEQKVAECESVYLEDHSTQTYFKHGRLTIVTNAFQIKEAPGRAVIFIKRKQIFTSCRSVQQTTTRIKASNNMFRI